MDSAAGSHRRWRAPLLFALAAVLALALVAGSPAATETRPTPLQKGIVLASPGVVFLTAHEVGRITGFSRQTSQSWDFAGSGFVVNPDGTVVTASHVIDPDMKSMRYYLANKLYGAFPYLDRYGASRYEPMPRSIVNAEQITSDSYNSLLGCYRGIQCKFEFPRSAEIIEVYTAKDLAGTAIGKPDRARVLTSTGFNNTDVAVLQIDESGLPTVPVAKTAGNLTQGQTLEAIGFPGSTEELPTGITEPSIAQAQVSTIRSAGGTSGQQIEVDAPGIEHGMSGGPVIDQNGRVVGLVSYSIILNGENGKNYLRVADDIQSALAQAGKHASSGSVDTDFATGMEKYWTQHYTTAVKSLNRVLAEDPGHTVATKYLRLATAKEGTSADKDAGGGFKWWWIVVIAAAVAAIGGLVFWLLRRRGKTAAPAAAPAPSAPPAEGAVPAPTPPAPPVPASAPGDGHAQPVIIVRDGSRAGERHAITNELSVGREKSDLVIEDPEISRAHAVLRAVDGGLEITDVGSANGTFVNGRRIQANAGYRLNDGDLITLGQTALEVESPKTVNATVVHQTLVAPTQDQ